MKVKNIYLSRLSVQVVKVDKFGIQQRIHLRIHLLDHVCLLCY